MDILYGKRFSKDLNAVRDEPKVRKRLLELIKKLKETDKFSDLRDAKKSKVIRAIFESRLEIIGSA